MMADELKPCPFCGGEASASSRMDEDLSTHNQVEWKNVGCDNCEVYFEIPDGYDCGTAGEQWNTRPAPKADSALVGGDIVGMLRKAAAEMRSTHHAGWPNVCDEAADRLAALSDRDVVLEEAAKDKERLDWLQSEMFDVRWAAGEGNQMCSPSDETVVRIVSHWMAEPQERVEAENWHEDLRAVIDEARQARSKERV